MSITMKSRGLAAVVAFAALVPSVSHAADCKTFAAAGSGLNNSIATVMAKQGAINIAEARGYSVQGEAKLISCSSTGIFGTECKASAHGCKSAH
jgi:K+-transporting ATPase c subunit